MTTHTVFDHDKIRKLILAAILSALIIVMTVVPYTGYITVGVIEITTLHIVVIIGACLLGWKYGAFLGAVWGITCMIRAFTNPLWIVFTNPLISVLPRILVGIISGITFSALSKSKLSFGPICIISAIVGTLTNTILVLSSMYAFGGMLESYAAFYELFKTIFVTVISLNGSIELVASIIIVPIVYRAISTTLNKHGKGTQNQK